MSVLDLLVFLPAVVGLGLLALPRLSDVAARVTLVVTTGAALLLSLALWVAYDPGAGVTSDIAFERELPWIRTVDAGYHVGLDGLSLPMVLLTTGLFFACALYAWRERQRPRSFAALLLVLETTCLGVFASLDLILFFVFFDLSIVAMYFVIAGWGHGPTAARSALKFFLYTFLGSLALLVGFLALFVGSDPHTFDMVALAQDPPLQGRPVAGGLALLAIGLGLAVKTPTVPFHTWLPPAHTDAPAVGSAILAGVLLKMGTYGFVRIALPVLPEAWRTWAIAAVVVGAVGVLYGALVALAQTDLKRLIAYTSVAHMGYVLLALGAVGMAGGDAAADAVAVSGAVTQMVSHGLITGALFLLAGVLQDRTGSYDLGEYGGLAGAAPRWAAAFAVGAFASLGLPGFTGFLAEFQVLAGSLGPAPVAVVVALLGLLVTAALFLWAMSRLLLGAPGRLTAQVGDLRPSELAGVVPLLLLALVLGVLPRPLLDVVEPAAVTVVELVGR